MDLFLEKFEDDQFKYRLLLAMVKDYFQHIVEHLLIFKAQNEQNLIVWVTRIKCIYFPIEHCDINFFVFQKLLLGNVIESIKDVRSGVLEGLSVIDFVLKLFDLL